MLPQHYLTSVLRKLEQNATERPADQTTRSSFPRRSLQTFCGPKQFGCGRSLRRAGGDGGEEWQQG